MRTVVLRRVRWVISCPQSCLMLLVVRQVWRMVTRPPPHTSLSTTSSRRLNLHSSPLEYPLHLLVTNFLMSALRSPLEPILSPTLVPLLLWVVMELQLSLLLLGVK